MVLQGIKFFFAIYALGFLAGTVSHILDIWQGGFLPYDSSPFPLTHKHLYPILPSFKEKLLSIYMDF